jgi:hypothetical protein
MTLVERLRAAGCHYGIPIERDTAEAADRIEQLEAALRCFLEDPRFHVAVGGNPHVVDRMLEAARAALESKPPTPANDDPEEIDTDNIGGLH